MSGIELNKIAAAILIACIIAMIAGIVSNALYKPELKVAQRGYKIEVSESTDTAPAATEEAPVDIAKLMATANADAGEAVAKKCLQCHNFGKDEPNKLGPNLWGVPGGPKAHRKDYNYSKALAAMGGVWDDESLYHFLHKPSKYIVGTKMSFAGISKPEDIANLIAYMKKKSS
jgi:cytochrome c